MNKIFRKVMKTSGAYLGAIQDKLECGHVKYTKSSEGEASERYCHECQVLSESERITHGTKETGGYIETWDSETNMPMRKSL